MLAAEGEITGGVIDLVFTSLRMLVAESGLQIAKKSFHSPALWHTKL